jgi:hypothetical protein
MSLRDLTMPSKQPLASHVKHGDIERIEKQVKEFLKRGGKVNEVPAGASALSEGFLLVTECKDSTVIGLNAKTLAEKSRKGAAANAKANCKLPHEHRQAKGKKKNG